MIKIKINEKANYTDVKKSLQDYSTLESVILLDIAIDILREDFGLSDNDIWEMLKDYRANMKEVE